MTKKKKADAGALLGIREYARYREANGLRGHTHNAVRAAIKTGRISTSVVKVGKRQMIDPARADIEWAQNTRGQKVRPPAGKEEKQRNGMPLDPAEQAELFPGSTEKRAPAEEVPVERSDIPKLSHSHQTQALWRSRITELEYRRRAGELGDVRQMIDEIRQTAHEVREAILQIPDRIVPMLAATGDEGEVRQLLESELREALAALSRSN